MRNSPSAVAGSRRADAEETTAPGSTVRHHNPSTPITNTMPLTWSGGTPWRAIVSSAAVRTRSYGAPPSTSGRSIEVDHRRASSWSETTTRCRGTAGQGGEVRRLPHRARLVLGLFTQPAVDIGSRRPTPPPGLERQGRSPPGRPVLRDGVSVRTVEQIALVQWLMRQWRRRQWVTAGVQADGVADVEREVQRCLVGNAEAPRRRSKPLHAFLPRRFLGPGRPAPVDESPARRCLPRRRQSVRGRRA